VSFTTTRFLCTLGIKIDHIGYRKRERTKKLGSTVLSPTDDCPERTTCKIMIRHFAAFCKKKIEQLSSESRFQKATRSFDCLSSACPKCGTVGSLVPHGSYERNLISHDGQKIVETRVATSRYKCKSCGRTHALLPDNVVPYCQHDLHFIFTVLAAYFSRTTTVLEVCSRFGIAYSTIYEWQKLLDEHATLLLGQLLRRETHLLSFLHQLIGSEDLSNKLFAFYSKHGFSFMQSRSGLASHSHSPRYG
jgi:hypothetical protein